VHSDLIAQGKISIIDKNKSCFCRWKLGVATFERTLDAVSLSLLIWKLNIDHSTSPENIGVTMAILEAMAIGMQLIDIVLTILPMIQVYSSILTFAHN